MPPDFPLMAAAACARLDMDVHMQRTFGDSWRLLNRCMITQRTGGRVWRTVMPLPAHSTWAQHWWMRSY